MNPLRPMRDIRPLYQIRSWTIYFHDLLIFMMWLRVNYEVCLDFMLREACDCLCPTTNQNSEQTEDAGIREHISLMRQDWGLKTNQTAQITRQARIRNPNKQTTSSNHVQLSELQSRERPERVYPACNGE